MMNQYRQSSNDLLKQLNKKYVWMNFVLIALAIISIVTLYVIKPFWGIEVAYNINSETIETLMEDTAGESGEGAGEGADVMDNIDWSAINLNETIKISVQLTPQSLFKATFAKDDEAVKLMLKDVVGGLLNNVNDIMKSIIKCVAKLGVAMAIESMKSELSDSVDQDLAAKLNVDGLNDIVERLCEDELSAAEVEDIKGDLVDFVMTQLNTVAESEGATLTDENKAEIRTELNSTLDEAISAIEDPETGKVNINNAAMLALKETGLVEDVSAIEGGLSGDAAVEAINNAVMNAIDEDTVKTISYAVKGMGGFLAFTMLCWALLAFFAFIHLFMRNKRATLWYAKLFCALPHIFLVGILTLVVKFMPDLMAKVGGDSEIASMLSGVSVKFLSGSWVSAICCAILTPFGWFFYNKNKRKIKKVKNGTYQG